MERALLIEWNPTTGKRAGDINPRDPALQCHGWQNMKVSPAVEIRLVEDERDLTSLEGVTGVTILQGKDAINAAIEAHIPQYRYIIQSETLMVESLKEKGGQVSAFAQKDWDTIAEEAYGMGLTGVIRQETRKLLE